MTIHTSADDDARDAAYLRADEARTAALEAARNARYARDEARHAEVERLRREAALERLGPCADCAEPRIDGSPRCWPCHVRHSYTPWYREPSMIYHPLILLVTWALAMLVQWWW